MMRCKKRSPGNVRMTEDELCVALKKGGIGWEGWFDQNCGKCRRAALFGVCSADIEACGMGGVIEEELVALGYPREGSFRFVLGRSLEEGLRMGDTWPKVCGHFKEGCASC